MSGSSWRINRASCHSRTGQPGFTLRVSRTACSGVIILNGQPSTTCTLGASCGKNSWIGACRSTGKRKSSQPRPSTWAIQRAACWLFPIATKRIRGFFGSRRGRAPFVGVGADADCSGSGSAGVAVATGGASP